MHDFYSRFDLIYPAIAQYLRELAAQRRITLLANEANAGFVQSVNRGMALHGDRDVVLLNSDTEVANDWLGRLHAAAHSAPGVATVTPFSNNATICSYPFEGWKGGVPGTLGLAAPRRALRRRQRGTLHRAAHRRSGVILCNARVMAAASCQGMFKPPPKSRP